MNQKIRVVKILNLSKIERQNIKQYYDFNPSDLVSKLNEIEGIKEKFNTLESLNCSENKILLQTVFLKIASSI